MDISLSQASGGMTTTKQTKQQTNKHNTNNSTRPAGLGCADI